MDKLLSLLVLLCLNLTVQTILSMLHLDMLLFSKLIFSYWAFCHIWDNKFDNDLEYIYTLYSLACENKQIDIQKLAKISEVVLRFALKNFNYNSIIAKKLILKTLPAFSKLKWSNVSKEINSFFYIAQTEWKNNSFSTENLITLIDCMGNLGTYEIAQSLSIFLGIINAKTERTKQYDEKLLLSIVNALGKLGSKTAFDYLLFIEYLNYSERIKVAARQAIKELKW